MRRAPRLFDVGARRWSDEIVETLEIPHHWLPEVRESPEPASRVSQEGSAATGLLEGTPVVAGAGDQAAEAVGCGIVEDGAVSVTIGTSGVVFIATSGLRVDPNGALHAYCHAVPEQWHLMGVMLSAGGSLRWYRDTLGREEILSAGECGIEAYDILLEEAARVPPGCEGLVFLPYLTGERTPHADPMARGAFVGLTLRHGKAHMTRSVLEGVTFGLMDSLRLARQLGVEISRVRASGGGARSVLWRQMMADVFDAEVATVNVTQGAAYGAAVLAAVGGQVHPGVPEAVGVMVRETDTTRPGAEVARYRTVYDSFRSLYPALAGSFRGLGAHVE